MILLASTSQQALVRNVRLRLKELRIPQAELARRAGCPNSYVSNVLHGKRVPGLDVIDRLAEALETTTPELLTPIECAEKISA